MSEIKNIRANPDLLMQGPELHLNWSEVHSGQFNSSDSSGQSTCPSHRQAAGMQSADGEPHTKWSAPQAGRAEQIFSSDKTRPGGQPHSLRSLLTTHTWEQYLCPFS